jgi:DNA uptake protein ComE-like DNA-binding protein
MKIVVAILCFLLMAKQAFSQVTETVTNNAEQQLENTAESNADQETEDDSFLQQLVQFLKDPVNLNTADEAGLAQLVILSPLQIRNLIMYRSLAGKMIDLYELQAIPGWDLATIQ